MEILGYAATILMGLSLGVLGGGGSILTVPILIYFFKMDTLLATTFSLSVVGSTSFVGASLKALKREVDFKTGLLFALPSFVGVYFTRAFLMPRIPATVLSIGSWTLTKSSLVILTFALVMLAASYSMLRPKTAKRAQESSPPPYFLIALQGLLVGFTTGFVGVGGGFLIIPALVILVGMPMVIAIGTSLAIIAANSVVGLIGDTRTLSQIDLKLLATLSIISLFGLFIGNRIQVKLPEKQLKKAFAFLLIGIGAFILLDHFVF